MIKTLGLRVLAVGKNVSPKKFVRIQLYLQVYLLATSIVFISVSAQVLNGSPFLCSSSDRKVTLSPSPSPVWDLLPSAGGSMLVYGLALFPSSLLCVLVHSFYGYIATVACVRIHILMTCLLCLVCVYSLARTILLVTLSCRNSSSDLLTWLPAIVPLYVLAAIAHLSITTLLINANVFDKKVPLPPKIVLQSSRNTASFQTPSSLMCRLGHIVKNPIDLIYGRNRHRLSSLRSLHVDNQNKVLIPDLPLTPQNHEGVGQGDDKFDYGSSDTLPTVASNPCTQHPQTRTARTQAESTIYQYLRDFQLSSRPVVDL